MLHHIQELVDIFLCPEVHVQRVQAEEVVLVAAGQSPFIQTGRIGRRRKRLRIGIWPIDCHGTESGETSGMVYMDTVQRCGYQHKYRYANRGFHLPPLNAS